MKALLLLLPGLSEPALDDLDGRTPLEAAATPAMDQLAQAGRVGRLQLAPAGHLPEDGSALLSLLGYDPRRERPGRGALEAAGLGVELLPGDLALRFDLLTTWRGRLADPWVGGIAPAEAGLLVAALAAALDDDTVSIHPGRGARHVLRLRGGANLDLITVPPGRVPDGEIDSCWPGGDDDEVLHRLMEAAEPVLAAHDVNRVRVDLGEQPAHSVWPWGPGRALTLEPFALRMGRSLAVLARGAAPRGLGVLVGGELPELPPVRDGADAVLRSTLAALDAYDTVMLHVDGPGPATPATLGELDRTLVLPLARALKERDDVRILLTTDRPSPALPPSTAVPFLAWGAGLEPGRTATFDATDADLEVAPGHAILDHLLGTGHTSRAQTGA
jgi:2,3-bisphosphoglycerate-independent phosphoglycerate mutase